MTILNDSKVIKKGLTSVFSVITTALVFVFSLIKYNYYFINTKYCI